MKKKPYYANLDGPDTDIMKDEECKDLHTFWQAKREAIDDLDFQIRMLRSAKQRIVKTKRKDVDQRYNEEKEKMKSS